MISRSFQSASVLAKNLVSRLVKERMKRKRATMTFACKFANNTLCVNKSYVCHSVRMLPHSKGGMTDNEKFIKQFFRFNRHSSLGRFSKLQRMVLAQLDHVRSVSPMFPTVCCGPCPSPPF